jgi:phasin
MAHQATSPFEVPPEMRALAERSVEQAKKAFDDFIGATQRAVSTFEGQAAAAQAGAKDITQQAMSFAERNVDASFDLARKLVRAKDPEEVIRLHAEYVKAQIEALGEQARDLGEATRKSASR